MPDTTPDRRARRTRSPAEAGHYVLRSLDARGRTEVLAEEFERPAPRQVSRRRILLESDRPDDRIIAGERMSGVVAVECIRGACRFELLLELIDLLDLEEAV